MNIILKNWAKLKPLLKTLNNMYEKDRIAIIEYNVFVCWFHTVTGYRTIETRHREVGSDENDVKQYV